MKKLMSLILALVMLFSLAVPAMAAEGDTYYIVGDFTNWGPHEPMTWNAAENRYEYVLTNVAATDSGEYLVTTTGSWGGTAYNDNGVRDDSNTSNARYTVAEDGSTVTLCFDGTKTFAIVTAPGEEAAGPSVTGEKEGDVTASYTPVIKITGMSIDGDNVTYDADANTYTVVATETPTLDLVFSGTNLNHIADADTTYWLETTPNGGEPYKSQLSMLFNSSTYDEETGAMIVEEPYPAGTDYTYRFSNDGGTTWEDGLRLVVKQGYAVTINEMMLNGTVTADKAFAAEGDTVTLTVTPNEGYELNDLAVTYLDVDDNWKFVPVTDNTFVMPAAEVSVQANFREFTGPYTVTVDDSIEGGTISVRSETYTAGERVIVDVHPDEGYVLDKVYATVASTGESLTVTNTAFVMPAANVNVTATFKKCYRIEDVFDDGGDTVDYPSSATEGETVTVHFTTLEGWELQYVDVIDRTSGQLIPHVMVDDNTFTFTMPAGEVDILFSFWKIGTDLETVYYKGPWTNMRVYFANDGTSVSDVIGVPTMVEAGIYAITNIPDHTARLRIINADTNEWFDIESIPTDGRNMYNAVTGEWETYTPSTPEDVTSASISWGSMSFTYTDGEDGAEGAWSADTTGGAGTVTVENTGTTTVTVSAVYTPEAAYAEITGTLGEEKTLAATESGTFTLTLSGKPNKALNGEKIGTVTVTIE